VRQPSPKPNPHPSRNITGAREIVGTRAGVTTGTSVAATTTTGSTANLATKVTGTAGNQPSSSMSAPVAGALAPATSVSAELRREDDPLLGFGLAPCGFDVGEWHATGVDAESTTGDFAGDGG
jgi:hypothetical protein